MQTFDVLRLIRDFGAADVTSDLAKVITTYIRSRTALKQAFGWGTGQYLEAKVGVFEDRFYLPANVSGIGNATGTAHRLEVYIHIR